MLLYPVTIVPEVVLLREGLLLAGRAGVAFQGRAYQHRRCERNQEEQVVPDWQLPPEHVMHGQKQDHHDRSGYFRSNSVARYCCANEARAQRRHQAQD